MIKVYEIISTAQSKTAAFLQVWINILIVCAVVGIIAQIVQQVLTRSVKISDKLKDFFEMLRDVMKIIVVSTIFIVFGMAFSGLLSSSESNDKLQLLNKDQYTFKIVDDKLIQLKDDNKNKRMHVQKDGDSKESEADTLEIVTETDEYYLCKANTSDRDTYVKVIKNEHNFEKEVKQNE